MQNEINHKNDISFEHCAFSPNRENLALFLTNYLKSKENGFVLNIDGKWGSGKSYFIKAWKNKIKNEHPTCYIDTWKTDFSKEPLIVIVNSILEGLKKQKHEAIGFDPEIEKKIIRTTLNIINNTAKAASPALGLISQTSAIIANIIGNSSEKLNEIMCNEKNSFDAYKDSIKGLETFKKELDILINEIIGSSNSTLSAPLFIFVDELDRCRPTYAIEFLETIKHLFDCKNIVFIIATNKTELEKSISKIYGNNFSSTEYLSRFFDRSSTLPEPDIETYLNTKNYSPNLTKYLNNHYEENYEFETNWLLSKIFQTFNIQLRQIDKLIEHLDALATNLNIINKDISPIVALTYICLNELNETHFESINIDAKINTIFDGSPLKIKNIEFFIKTDKFTTLNIIEKSFSNEAILTNLHNDSSDHIGRLNNWLGNRGSGVTDSPSFVYNNRKAYNTIELKKVIDVNFEKRFRKISKNSELIISIKDLKNHIKLAHTIT